MFVRENGIPIVGATLKVPPAAIARDWHTSQREIRGGSLFRSGSGSPNRQLMQTSAQSRAAKQGAQQDIQQNAQQSAQQLDLKEMGISGGLTDEGIASFDLFLSTRTTKEYLQFLRNQSNPLSSPWFDEYMEKHKPNAADVLVDAHVLATPVIADLQGQGKLSLIVPVSYYYAVEDYSSPEQVQKMGNLDLDMYSASGIVIFDLTTRTLTHSLLLEIGTLKPGSDSALLASPTVVDMDMDGKLEIVIGSSLGFVYMITADGRVAETRYFPFSMGSIHAAIAVDDVDGDGAVELIVSDANSNLVCLDNNGIVKWETSFVGVAESSASIADVNQDGTLDVVLATDAGFVWAVNGNTGKLLENFPVKMKGRARSQPLITEIGPPVGPTRVSIAIVLHASDGFVYVISANGCADKIDIGESSRSMVLADDVTGEGLNDLIVATSSGVVHVIETHVSANAFNRWPSQFKQLNGFSHLAQGIAVLDREHFSEITGTSFPLRIQIRAKRTQIYHVVVRIGNTVLHNSLLGDGVHTIQVDAPHTQMHALLHIQATNDNGQLFEDTLAISFNYSFQFALKWFLIGPFLVATLAIIAAPYVSSPSLPMNLD